MEERAKVALEASIEHWEGIVAGEVYDECSLCNEFDTGENNCEDCPVKNSTGRIDCQNTPFYAWRRHRSLVHETINKSEKLPDCIECTRLAQAELDFLKSLREGVDEMEKMTPEEQYPHLKIIREEDEKLNLPPIKEIRLSFSGLTYILSVREQGGVRLSDGGSGFIFYTREVGAKNLRDALNVLFPPEKD